MAKEISRCDLAKNLEMGDYPPLSRWTQYSHKCYKMEKEDQIRKVVWTEAEVKEESKGYTTDF